MNIDKNYSFLEYTPQTLPPAQLWIGNHTTLVHNAELFLQTMLCKNNKCNTCITCMHIREKQHHAVMWLHPEKNYTMDQLEGLFNTLTFQLQPQELFFFIIQKADFLPAACANKLLKSIEEPPQGYHFILLAHYKELILPTIQSRCIHYLCDEKQAVQNVHPFYKCFTQKTPSIDEFSKIIDTTTINEKESAELIDTILHYWITTINTAHNDNKIIINLIIQTLQEASLRPPMPGSSILFWRNLYLQVHKNINLVFEV